MADDKKIKILIIDDDDSMRNLYSEVFKHKGFEVSEALDGVEGLDKATKDAPDVIFTGIIMPRMDGFSLMEALQKNIATSNIPVVISSHMGREEDRKKAQEMGASEFIARDMNTPNEVVEKIKAILKTNEYKLKFNPDELDAPNLLKDMRVGGKFQCASCGGEMVMAVKFTDAKNHLFSGKFVCAQCGKAQN